MDTSNRLHEGAFHDANISHPGAAHANVASMADLLQLMGHEAADQPLAATVPVPLRRVRAGAPLYHEGGAADSVYFVRAGTFKIFHTAEDGYEQVLGFAGRSEVLGFDAVCMGRHPTEAVALEDSSVFALLVRDLFALGQDVPALGRLVHLSVSRALARRSELADLMAAVAAEVRLARFMVQLSQRMAACGQSPRRFHLRMSRRDIASHLGVAHETVSRSFSALAALGYLQVENREVEIVDMDGLKAFARSTRRQLDDHGPAHARPATLLRPVAPPRALHHAPH